MVRHAYSNVWMMCLWYYYVITPPQCFYLLLFTIFDHFIKQCGCWCLDVNFFFYHTQVWFTGYYYGKKIKIIIIVMKCFLERFITIEFLKQNEKKNSAHKHTQMRLIFFCCIQTATSKNCQHTMDIYTILNRNFSSFSLW